MRCMDDGRGALEHMDEKCSRQNLAWPASLAAIGSLDAAVVKSCSLRLQPWSPAAAVVPTAAIVPYCSRGHLLQPWLFCWEIYSLGNNLVCVFVMSRVARGVGLFDGNLPHAWYVGGYIIGLKFTTACLDHYS